MRQLTDAQKRYIAVRKEIQRQDQLEADRMASTQLWRDCKAEDWCDDAARARKESEELRAAKERERSYQWRERVAQATASTWIELDLE